MKASVLSVLVLVLVVSMSMFMTTEANAQVIRRVDKSATGAGNGVTWADAFTTIQPAIDAVWAAGGGEVWVAGGPIGAPVIYDEVRSEVWGGVTGSLVMKDNVHVYGGFEGWRNGTGAKESLRSQRQPGINITIIDGGSARGGNPAYHTVVFGRATLATVHTRLDGFHITGGNASGVNNNYHTWRGGGIYIWQSSPVIANCYIFSNVAAIGGGGVDTERGPAGASDAIFENCVIAGNSAYRVNTEVPANPIRGGGGVFINRSNPVFTHVTIANNNTNPTGALPGSDNYGLNSGGIYNWGDLVAAGSASVQSSIIWGNTGTGILNEGGNSSATVTYTDIQGGWTGTGNINLNPNFVGVFPWAFQINGAPCLDAGSSSLTADIRTVPRPLGAAPDMGAYEYSGSGPVAVCKNHSVYLDVNCFATMTPSDIDGGSSAQAGIAKLTASKTVFGSGDIPNAAVILTVTDKIGRTATCNANVAVNDPIPPVITFCPPNTNVSANASCVGQAPNLAALVVATDNCGIGSITQSPPAGTPLPLGPTPIQIFVNDVGGNQVLTCAPVVTVVDNTPPTITLCPPPQTVVPDPNCNAIVPDFTPTGTYTDNCGIASVTQNPPPNSVVQGTTSILITVTDTSNNVSTCTTQLILSDTTPPVAVCQPITVYLSSPTVNGQAIDGGSTDNCGITTWLIDGNPTKTFTCANIPSVVVSLTVKDAANNSASCNAVVTVIDNVPPIAVCQNITVNLSSPTIGPAAIDGGSTDNCGITNRLIDGQASRTFTCADVGPNIVTLTVFDAAGNSSNCQATVTVVDDINPVAVCQNITVYLSSPSRLAAAIDGGSTDNCGIVTRLINGNASHTFTCADRPSTQATLTVRDAANNSNSCQATVTVIDDVPPIISMNGVSPVNVECGSTYTDAGATASDNCDGALVPNVNSNVNTAVPGDYTVTYTVSDSAGNPAAPVIRQVKVVDTTPPVITILGINPVTVECGATYTDAGATAVDVCDGALTPNAVSNVNTAVPGSYTVTYTVSDAAGNPATPKIRQVNVVDTTKPVISMNGTSPVTVECGTSYTDAGATASDICAGTLTPNAVSTVNVNVVGNYTVTYTVSDGNGNNADPVVRQVNVVDTIPPIITRLGDAIVYVPVGDPYVDAGATAADQCDGDLTASIITVNPVDVNTPNVYYVTYDVTDSEGNAAVQKSRMVIVSDTSQPDVVSVTVESALTVLVRYNKSMDGGVGHMDPANYTVSGSGKGTLNDHPASVERVSATIYRLTWLRPNEMFNGGDIRITVDPDVEDSAGNFMRYNVGEDSHGAIGEAPVITLNGSNETLECGVDTFVEAGATAEDNVDGPVDVDIEGEDLVNTAVPGAYVILYTAVDAAGNEAVVTRTITVEDTTNPELALNGAAEMTLECNIQAYVELGAVAWDACAGDLTAEIIIGGDSVNTAILGTQTVTYTVSDNEGNESTAQRTVNVVDTTAPSIWLLGANPYVTTDGALYVEPGAMAWDICEGDLTAAIDILGEVENTNAVAVYELTYVVSDSSDNEASVTRTVVVKPEGCTPAFVLSVSPNPALPGSEVVFEVTEAAGSCSAGALSYLWLKAPLADKSGFVVIPGAPNAPVYTLPEVGYEDAGIYKCTVSDASESVDTNTVTFRVDTGVPVAGAAGILLASAVVALIGTAALRKRR